MKSVLQPLTHDTLKGSQPPPSTRVSGPASDVELESKHPTSMRRTEIRTGNVSVRMEVLYAVIVPLALRCAAQVHRAIQRQTCRRRIDSSNFVTLGTEQAIDDDRGLPISRVQSSACACSNRSAAGIARSAAITHVTSEIAMAKPKLLMARFADEYSDA